MKFGKKDFELRYLGDISLEAETERIQAWERIEKPGHTYSQADRLRESKGEGSKKNDRGKSSMERKRKITVTWARSPEGHQGAVGQQQEVLSPGI